MSATVFLFDPRPPVAEAASQALGTLGHLAGKVVGFIDNAKPNFRELVDDMADLLASRHGVATVIKRQKPVATVPASPEVLAELVAQCDLVVTGSGD
jgi:N-acyl-D-aspartate/D-glutamate deacylase